MQPAESASAADNLPAQLDCSLSRLQIAFVSAALSIFELHPYTRFLISFNFLSQFSSSIAERVDGVEQWM